MPVKSPILHSKNAKSNEKFMKLRNPDLLWVASATSVATGIVWCFYLFWVSLSPYPGIDLGIYGWAETPPPAQILVVGSSLLGLVLPVPTFIRGLKRFKILGRGRAVWIALRAISGPAALLAAFWAGSYPTNSCHIAGNVPVPTQCPAGSPAVVAWGEFGVVAFLLLLLFGMKRVISRPLEISDGHPDSPPTRD